MATLTLIGLIVLNGLFAMSEIALVMARKARLKKLASQGDRAAAIALKLGEDPTRFLSTIQIGITAIGLLNGIVGEAALAAPLSVWLQSFDVPRETADLGATALVVVVVTYVSIVIGELAPKRLGQITPEPIARLVARPMQLLALMMRPFVMLLSASTHGLLRLLGVRPNQHASVTEEEIYAMLEEGSRAGVIEQHEHRMARNIFRLDDRQAGSLMTPRADVVFIDIQLPTADNLQRLIKSEHSRFPVCNGGLHRLLGVIQAKQVLACMVTGQSIDFSAMALPCLHVPEATTGMELLEQFRTSPIQMALVIDEYGEVEGVVTLQDVLEAVTGAFMSGDGDDEWAVQREDGSWLLDGSMPVAEVQDLLELKGIPEEGRGGYHTLSGMMMLLLGKIPSTGEHANWEGWRFEVVDMDGKRIDKVMAHRP